MRNTIRFYYNFDDIYVSKMNGINYVKYKNKIYTFTEISNKESALEAYSITKNYSEYEKIILNKDGTIFTPYSNGLYVLIEKKSKSKDLPTTRLLPNNINYMLDRTSWGTLWEKKVDYFEYQIRHIKGTYKSIDESIDYFIGMAESAISYMNYNAMNSAEQKAICRRRMDNQDYYNPLNIVVDNRMRDIGEYLKMLFWSNSYNLKKVLFIVKKIEPNLNNYKLLYARLIYPSYYFDAYERVINNKEDEEVILKIINRIDEYEKYIDGIYQMLKNNNKNLSKVEWL